VRGEREMSVSEVEERAWRDGELSARASSTTIDFSVYESHLGMSEGPGNVQQAYMGLGIH